VRARVIPTVLPSSSWIRSGRRVRRSHTYGAVGGEGRGLGCLAGTVTFGQNSSQQSSAAHSSLQCLIPPFGASYLPSGPHTSLRGLKPPFGASYLPSGPHTSLRGLISPFRASYPFGALNLPSEPHTSLLRLHTLTYTFEPPRVHSWSAPSTRLLSPLLSPPRQLHHSAICVPGGARDLGRQRRRRCTAHRPSLRRAAASSAARGVREVRSTPLRGRHAMDSLVSSSISLARRSGGDFPYDNAAI